MNALPAASAAIWSGFLSSLGQLAASPWALVPLAVAVIVGGGCIRYARRPGHVVIAPPELCPWCGTHACRDRTLCSCEEPCGSWLCVVKEVPRG